MTWETAEGLLSLALILTALGGSIGTGVIVIWQRNGFRAEVNRLGEKWDREREDWERKERGYIERITRLETTVEMLTRLIPKSSLNIQAAGNATIGGDAIGGDANSQ